MRKFKLRDQVARKMKGIENTAFAPRETGAEEKAAEKSGTERREEFHAVSRTDIGLIRKSNQDAVILGGSLMGVADGMGGHNGGETASSSARDGMLRETENREPTEENLRSVIRQVNLELWETQLGSLELSGMGTTLTVLWPAGANMLIGHVGDSRAYLLRDGETRQVTQDHSMVADMVRRGMLTEEQAATHPMRNYITRAVGTESDIRADILSVERKKGDRWLVCSDGLHGAVAKARLWELMGREDIDEAADEMIREALDSGGRDNITLVLAEDLTGGAGEQEPRSEAEENQTGAGAGPSAGKLAEPADAFPGETPADGQTEEAAE